MAKKSGSRSTRIDRNSDKFKERVQRRDNYRKQRDKNKGKKIFAERMLGAYGLGEENFKKGGFVKGKLGLFAGAMQEGREASSPPVSPTMETPKTERERQNPSISTIVEQLNSLIRVANRIGAITEQQQEQLQQQISQAARDSKEASMERGTASAISNVSGTNLTPLNEEISTLIDSSLKPFRKMVDEKVKEQEEEQGPKGFMQRFAESYGVGDEYERYAKRRAARKARIPQSQLLDKNGRRLSGGALQQRIKRINAERAATPTKLAKVGGMVKNAGAGLLNVAKRATGGVGRVAAKVGGARLAAAGGSVTKKIASLVGKGVRGAGVAASASRNVGASVIRRVAGPIIKKALGSTVLKSIPIVGAVAGGLFAAKKLLEGDPVGAGLEAASGLGGPITAIPALVASAARDTYSSVFDVQPEQDPMFGLRMKLITGVIGAMVTAYFASKIVKKPTPTKDAVDKATVPPKPAQQTSGQTATGMPAVPKAPVAPATSAAPASPSPSSSSSAPPKSSPASTGKTAPTKRATESRQQKTPSNDTNDAAKEQAGKSQTMVNSAPNTGADIAKMTSEVENAANQPSAIDLGSKRPLPSTSPPTKSGVSGAGNVPDPNYYGMGEIATQVYFNPNPATLS